MYKSYKKQRIEEIEKKLKGWMFRTARGIQTYAQRKAPRFTGLLARGIKTYLAFPITTVAVNIKYAKFVEGCPKATKRHFVSWVGNPSFERWARRVYGADTSKPGGLLVWGYATNFFSGAIKVVTPKAKLELRSLRIEG